MQGFHFAEGVHKLGCREEPLKAAVETPFHRLPCSFSLSPSPTPAKPASLPSSLTSV